MIILQPDEVAAQIIQKDGRIALVSHATRVGVTAYFAAIEWYWYAPDTSRNRFLNVFATDWRDMRWVVLTFPGGRLAAARRLAKQLGLKIADGPPVMLGAAGAVFNVQATMRPSRLAELQSQGVPFQFFPGTYLPDGSENPAIFTIENEQGSPIYKNRRRDDEAMLQASAEINDLLNHGIKLTPAEIADYIYGSGSFPNK